jgi:hypothetical protein
MTIFAFLQLTFSFIIIIYYLIGNPPVAGIVKSNNVEIETLRRMVEVASKKKPPLVPDIEQAKRVSKIVLGCGQGPSSADFHKALGISAVAKPRDDATGTYGKKPFITLDDDDDDEIETKLYEGSGTDIDVDAKTGNGTPVMLSPSHCVWTCRDTDGRTCAGVSVVLPSSVGMNTRQLDFEILNGGTALRINMFHPPTWCTLKFHEKACEREGMDSKFIHFFLQGEELELKELAILSRSREKGRISTFCVINLPVPCEKQIKHMVPIHHKETGTTTYLFCLYKVRDKNDYIFEKEAKKLHVFDDDDEKIVALTPPPRRQDTPYPRPGPPQLKRQRDY